MKNLKLFDVFVIDGEIDVRKVDYHLEAQKGNSVERKKGEKSC